MSGKFPAGKGRRLGSKTTSRPVPTPASLLSYRLAQLQKITTRFNQIKEEYAQKAPSRVVFNENGKLKFGAKENAPMIEIEEAFIKLILEIDSIESDGEEEVRSKRKQLVKDIESELAQLDLTKKAMFEREQSGLPQTEPVVAPVVEVDAKRASKPSSPKTTELDVAVIDSPIQESFPAASPDSKRDSKRQKEDTPLLPPGIPIPLNPSAPVITTLPSKFKV